MLQARDHRDTKALTAFLADTSSTVREAAALAFASVQDSASFPSLMPLLADRSPRVREAAAFALSFTKDSTRLTRLDARIDQEPDSLLRVRMDRYAFCAAVALKKNAMFLLSYLESDDPAIRTRATAMLGRCPKEQLLPLENDVLHAISVERDPDVRVLLVPALRYTDEKRTLDLLQQLARTDPSSAMRVNALRALGKNAAASFLLDRLNDTIAAVRQTVIEQLQQRPSLDAQALWEAGQHQPDPNTMIPLYGMVMRFGDTETRNVCGALLAAMAQQDLGPYLQAQLVKARYTRYDDGDSLRAIMRSPAPAMVRQAAFEQWTSNFQDFLKDAEIDQHGRDRIHAGFMRDALLSGDAGLIAAAAEQIAEEQPDYLKSMLDNALVTQVRASLHPIRDLEALQLLDAAVAKRDGKPAPAHVGPSFNHPIDRARLGALKNSQRYRITTTKGEIIVAIEPDAAPGSCVAFDSLVTTGYYNGKTFHRVVPNFVAQGGCPRGDGYGSMPWTLRTEIGYEGFTTGTVGLASAGRDTESCQFFITLMPAPHLDGHYTRFAHVVSGMDVAQRLVVGDRIVSVVGIP